MLLRSKLLKLSPNDSLYNHPDISELLLLKLPLFLAGSEALYSSLVGNKLTAILDSNSKHCGSCQLLLCSILLLSGDIQQNPGPPKYPCGLCHKLVKRNQRAIECDECSEWFHTKCIHMTSQTFNDLGADTKLLWLCNRCMFPNFSTSFLLSDSQISATPNSFECLSQQYSPSCSFPPGPPLHCSSPRKKPGPQRPRKRKLKVISLNCNGLKGPGKVSEFHSLIELHEPDIILGCESKLDYSILSYSVFPDLYDIFRKDRTRFGVGVFVAVRSDLAAVEERRLDVDSEIITISLQFQKCKKLYVSSFYRPPTQDRESLDQLDDSLSKLFNTRSNYPNLVLGGDFNCGNIDWSSLELQSDINSFACDRALLEIAEKYSLNQHVKTATRPTSGRTLDLVFSTNSSLIQACHTTHGISDHDAILFEVDVTPKPATKPPRKVFQFHKGNYDGLCTRMASFADEYLGSCPGNRSVDENWARISDTIKTAIDQFIPSKMTKAKRHVPSLG